jgi:predicted Zn-dependent protease
LVIRSIGAFTLTGAAGDLTSNLEAKPVVSFIWKLLLAREVRGDPHLAREALGDELSPGISDSARRQRVRKQIYDLQKDIRSELAALIRTDRTHVWLDLDSTDFDAAGLKKLCNRIAGPGSLIDRNLAQQVRQMLSATSGEFLAGFEDLQHRVTQGNGTAGEVVEAARQLIANQRADLTRAFADYLDASGQVEEAIPHLKAALGLLPERQDLARLLVAAYLQTGQTARASELRSSYNLNLEGSK